MKIRTVNELQDALDSEFSWRLKEIHDISSRAHLNSASIRAAVALVYAHWEGFVKASADFYIIFVQSRRLKTNELSSGLKWLSLKNKLESLSLNKKSTTGIEAMIALEEALVRRASFSSGFRCRTDSNLSSKVFEEIVTSIGIDYEPYATKANFIDKELLERRNQIAHGERLDLLAGDYIKLKDNVLSLMRELKTDIENHCASKLFKVEP